MSPIFGIGHQKKVMPNLDIQVLSEHTAMATGVRFGERANYIGSTSMDRTLKIYAE